MSSFTAIPLKTNLSAAAPPSVSNDVTQGYAAGSTWLDGSTGVFWRALSVSAAAAVWVPMQVLDAPLFRTGRYYTNFEGTTSNTLANLTVDTVVYLVPYYIRQACTIASLNIRVVTAGALSAVKFAVWANNPATGLPTGAPIAGLASNSGQSTASNNTVVSLTGLSKAVTPGLYWWGLAFTAASPACIAIAGSQTGLSSIAGRTNAAANLTLQGFTTSYTYATDITALDLTGATLTDVVANPAAGIPVTFFGV